MENKDQIVEALDAAIREKIHGVRMACLTNLGYVVLSGIAGTGVLMITPSSPAALTTVGVVASLLPFGFGLYCAKEFLGQLRWVVASIDFEKHLGK